MSKTLQKSILANAITQTHVQQESRSGDRLAPETRYVTPDRGVSHAFSGHAY